MSKCVMHYHCLRWMWEKMEKERMHDYALTFSSLLRLSMKPLLDEISPTVLFKYAIFPFIRALLLLLSKD
jgi:hypothetical protein